VLDDAAAGLLEYFAYLPCREAEECSKADGGRVELAVDAVEEKGVKVRRIELSCGEKSRVSATASGLLWQRLQPAGGPIL
jgi:hypothetical protein